MVVVAWRKAVNWKICMVGMHMLRGSREGVVVEMKLSSTLHILHSIAK